MRQLRISRKMITAVAAALAAVGVPGLWQSAALARSPSVLNWTRQHPAASPSARWFAPMAYDAATGTAVLFGGATQSRTFSDTWTWDGSTWAKRDPATHPSVRGYEALAYDAAARAVVLFGGLGGGRRLDDTWTWNGSTWTKQAPAAHPSVRNDASMAYDAATGTAVLFGGYGGKTDSALGDTWTWDGSTWTKQAPATSPPARYLASMAYDAATATIVMFGGINNDRRNFGDTWTWDGSTWTKQAPATHPTARADEALAYDAAARDVVLFGGTVRGPVKDTWTWGAG
ncbi:MAG TPA: kelch repeat-containing protein [Streptosporangiaceae bacterium]|nr:kelch repeat-containing protein [Streptosporangiaceae bacterium]